MCLAVRGLPAQQNNQKRQPFAQAFALRGVKFTEKQQANIKELRQKYVPKLIELQKRRFGVYTNEQRRIRRKALQAARDAGKKGRELRQIVDKAVKLSKEQQKQLTVLLREQSKLLQVIQGEVRSLLTAEQRKRIKGGKKGRAVRPTHGNVKYGPHERNVMDVWLAKSPNATPVLVSIHGGGFRGGNKSVNGDLLRRCLDSGISVVAITYRLSQHAIAPAQFLDSARAIQFVRHKAKEWNLDPKRIAATGGSAGAGLSLWLGFHTDFANPKSKDPVLRQSSRLTCMSVYNGQTSYDPRFIRKLFPGTDTYKHPALAQLYDVDLNKLDDLPKEKYKLFELVSSINHLTKDDVPAQLIYASRMDTPITSQGIGIHHPKFAKVLKERMDKLGIECQIHTGIRRGDTRWTTLTLGFVKKHFGMNK